MTPTRSSRSTADALKAPSSASVTAVKGEAADFARLVGLLDLEVKGFKMHQR